MFYLFNFRNFLPNCRLPRIRRFARRSCGVFCAKVLLSHSTWTFFSQHHSLCCESYAPNLKQWTLIDVISLKDWSYTLSCFTKLRVAQEKIFKIFKTSIWTGRVSSLSPKSRLHPSLDQKVS